MRRDTRILGLVGGGHFLSHFYSLTLPPLFPLIKADYGLSFVQLGLMLTAFNAMAAAAQIPVGLVVDRVGARGILAGGLVVEAGAIGAMAFAPDFTTLLALALLAGLGHSVFHPADYSILMSAMDHSRIGRAFSLHTFMGSAGSALAPAALIFLTGLWNWRIALMIVAAIGLVAAAALFAARLDAPGAPAREPRKPRKPRRRNRRKWERGVYDGRPVGIRVLFTAPVLVLFLFFLTTTIPTSGITMFSVVALTTLHDMPLATANSALTGYLIAVAAGVLVGGVVADKSARHDRIAVVAFIVTAVILALLGEVRLELVALVSVFTLMGILQGMVRPARDMMVRAITPPGTAGTVFAFMSLGRLLGGTFSPVLFGWIIDIGAVRWLFWLLAIVMIAALGTLCMPRTTRRKGATDV